MFKIFKIILIIKFIQYLNEFTSNLYNMDIIDFCKANFSNVYVIFDNRNFIDMFDGEISIDILIQNKDLDLIYISQSDEVNIRYNKKDIELCEIPDSFYKHFITNDKIIIYGPDYPNKVDFSFKTMEDLPRFFLSNILDESKDDLNYNVEKIRYIIDIIKTDNWPELFNAFGIEDVDEEIIKKLKLHHKHEPINQKLLDLYISICDDICEESMYYFHKRYELLEAYFEYYDNIIIDYLTLKHNPIGNKIHVTEVSANILTRY